MIKSSVQSLQATWKSGALAFYCSNILLTSPVIRLNNFQMDKQQEAVVSGSQMFLSPVSSNLELRPAFIPLLETGYIL